MSTLITTSTYNNLQATVEKVMGLGTGNSGYGQPIASSPITGTTITAQQWNNLRSDMAKAYAHQTNVAAVNTSANISVNPPNLQIISANTLIANEIFTQYANFTSNINVNRLAAHPNQMTPNVAVTSVTRSQVWGGSVDVISTTVTVTFPGYSRTGITVSPENHRRCFFNAGGSIEVRSTLSGFSAQRKNFSWNAMFNAAGVFSLRANNSSITGALRPGSSLSNTVGFHQLTTTPRQMLRQTAFSGAYYDANYQENSYNIEAWLQGVNQIVFRITYRDDDQGDRRGLGPAVDEEVNGNLSAIITCTRPTGSNVDVPQPTGSATAIS
jgi:hypothetical protein